MIRKLSSGKFRPIHGSPIGRPGGGGTSARSRRGRRPRSTSARSSSSSARSRALRTPALRNVHLEGDAVVRLRGSRERTDKRIRVVKLPSARSRSGEACRPRLTRSRPRRRRWAGRWCDLNRVARDSDTGDRDARRSGADLEAATLRPFRERRLVWHRQRRVPCERRRRDVKCTVMIRASLRSTLVGCSGCQASPSTTRRYITSAYFLPSRS